MYESSASHPLWQAFLTEVKQLIVVQKLAPPRVFISYAWEGDGTATSWLQERLTRWEADLTAVGITVFFDLSGMGGKSDIKQTMRENLEKSKVVLAICTPSYALRVQDTKTNVGYEYQETLKKMENPFYEVYPLWLAGSRNEAVPDTLQKLKIIDCRNTLVHECHFAEQVLLRLFPILQAQASYTKIWQTFKQTAFGATLPSISEKIKSLLPLVPVDSELTLPLLNGEAHAPQTLSDFLLHIGHNTRQSATPGPRQSTVNLIIERESQYRDIYWSQSLRQAWSDLTQTLGILPLYIPLQKIPAQSTDLIGDWLLQNGFTELVITALKNHYAFLVILAGYDSRLTANEMNLLQDSHWQEWRGQTIVLCDASKQTEAEFIDSYLQSHNLPKATCYTLTYPPTAVEFDFMQPSQPAMPPHRLVKQLSRQEAQESLVDGLSEDEITQQWHTFLQNIQRIKPMQQTLYLSYVDTVELLPQIAKLRQAAVALGLRWSSDISQSDIILVICSPAYLAASKADKQMEYQAITQALQQPHRAVYPLWYAGNSFGESVPSELFKLLVRDCRDPAENYYQWGSLESPLGLIPAMLDIRVHTPQGQDYQQHWQQFRTTVWGKEGQPSGVLHKLKVLSRQMAKQETLYQSTKRYYQDPQVKLSKDAEPSGNLTDFLHQLLEQASVPTHAERHPVHLLFAEPGSGKSMSVLRLEEQLWENFHRYHLIPIRIPLSQIHPEQTDFVSRWLHDKAHYSSAEIKQLQQRYRFVILLDGYDEFVFSHGDKHNIVQLANVAAYSGVTLITCRTQLESQAGRFQSMGAERRYLCPFTTIQIDTYLAAQAKDKPELTAELRQRVHVLPGLLQLITNPLMLYITTDILPDLAQTSTQETLTRYSVYERFTHKWFLREFVRAVNQGLLKVTRIRVQELEPQLLQYAQQIAVMMFRDETLHIVQSKLDRQAQALLHDVLFDDEQAQQTAIATLRNACPLKLIGNSFQFIHKSFQEFLVAQKLLTELPLVTKYIPDLSNSLSRLRGRAELGADESQQFVYDHRDAQQFQTQLSQLEINLWNHLELRKEPAVLDFLSDTKPNQYRLLQVITESKGENINHEWQGNPRIAQAAGNAITLFTYCGYSASGLNLNHTQLEKADVSGGLFCEAQVENANWRDVVAAQTQWQNASIQQSHWDVNYGEYAYCEGNSGITCLAVSPLNQNIVTAGYGNGDIITWDIQTQRRVKRWRACSENDEMGSVISIAYSTDGQRLVSQNSIKDRLQVWDTRTGALLSSLAWRINKLIYRAGCVAIVDNTVVSGCRDNTPRVWNLMNGICLCTLQGHTDNVICVAVHGDIVVSGSSDTTLRVWNLTNGVCLHTLRGHREVVTHIALDGNTLVSGSRDGTLRVWSLMNGICLHMLQGHADAVSCLALHGEIVVSGSSDTMLCVWNLANGICLHTLRGHTSRINCVAIVDNTLVSGSDDRMLKVWSLTRGTCLRTLLGHKDLITCLTFHNDTVVSGSGDGTLRVWSLMNDICVDPFKGNTTGACLALHGDTGVWMEVNNRTLCVWNLTSGICLRTLEVQLEGQLKKYDNRRITCVALHGDTVVSGFGTELHVWNLTNGVCLHTLGGFPMLSEVICIAMQGDTVVSGAGSSLYVWNLTSGILLRKLQSHREITCIAVHGDIVVSGYDDRMLKVWSLTSGTCLHTLRGHKRSISCVALHGNTVVSAEFNDSTLRVWHLSTQTNVQVVELPGNTGDILRNLAFHPRNSHWLIAVYGSGRIVLWDITAACILVEQQFLRCHAATWDIERGCLLLMQNSGAILCARISPTQYVAADLAVLPPWQLVWARSVLALDVTGLQIEGANIVSTRNTALLRQRGAGNANMLGSRNAVLLRQHDAEDKILNYQNNQFCVIHCYLVQKEVEKPATAQVRLNDFTTLLQTLHSMTSVALFYQLEQYLVHSRRFYQRNPFASADRERNRYHHLRNALLTLDGLTLRTQFQQYLDYLKGKLRIDLSRAAATQIPEQVESLRQRLCEILNVSPA